MQWDETVKLLMELERKPVVLLEQRKSAYQSQLTNWSGIESRLSSLKSATDSIESADEMLTKSISASDDTILTATADSTAIEGSHQILINQLATNHIIVHTTGWADRYNTPVNNSGVEQSFSYSYAGENITVAAPDGTTLAGLAKLINNDPDNPGVVASILNDGSGGASAYHLVLSGKDTGEDNTITIIDTVDNPTDLSDGDDFDPSEWNVTQTAQNAELRVDGFPDPDWGWPNPWIESDSNDVKDIIPGVTLHLQNVSPTDPIQIEISLNKADVKAKVNTFIKAFNDLISTVNSLTSHNVETETSGPLANDSVARTFRSMFTALVSETVPGMDESDRYRSLGEVGVKVTSGGTLKLDSSKFDEALSTDAEAVARLFVYDSVSSSTFVSAVGHGDNTVGGSYDFTISYDADGVILPNGTNTIGGENASVQGDTIISGAEDSPSEGLLLLLNNPGDGPGSLSGTMKVYTGVAAMLSAKINDLTDSIDGRVTLNRKRIKDQMDSLNDRIDAWDERLTKIEEAYNKKFLAMETLIGQLKTQSNYLSGVF